MHIESCERAKGCECVFECGCVSVQEECVRARMCLCVCECLGDTSMAEGSQSAIRSHSAPTSHMLPPQMSTSVP